MADLRDILDRAALTPTGDPLDLRSLAARAVARRRVRRVGRAAAGALLIGAVSIGAVTVLRDPDDGGSITASGDAPNAGPASTTTTASPAPTGEGLRIDPPLPDGWIAVAGPLYHDTGGLPSRNAEVTVATFEAPAEPSAICSYPITALERLGPTDAFVSVLELPPGAAYVDPRPSAESFLPAEATINQLPEGERDIDTEMCLARQPDFRFKSTGFTENGRMVVVHVGLGADASRDTETAVLDIVQRIVVEPRT